MAKDAVSKKAARLKKCVLKFITKHGDVDLTAPPQKTRVEVKQSVSPAQKIRVEVKQSVSPPQKIRVEVKQSVSPPQKIRVEVKQSVKKVPVIAYKTK